MIENIFCFVFFKIPNGCFLSRFCFIDFDSNEKILYISKIYQKCHLIPEIVACLAHVGDVSRRN